MFGVRRFLLLAGCGRDVLDVGAGSGDADKQNVSNLPGTRTFDQQPKDLDLPRGE